MDNLNKVYKIGSQLNKNGDLEITLLINENQCILTLKDDFIVKSCEDILNFRCENYWKTIEDKLDKLEENE